MLFDEELESLVNDYSPTNPIPIIPNPGFVVKTVLLSTHNLWTKGMKIFLNYCYSPCIPAPPLLNMNEIAISIKSNNSKSYSVPLSLSPSRADSDKQGQICMVFDLCINSTPYLQSQQDPDFKVWLIQLGIEWVMSKQNIDLDLNYSLPKMIKKGTLVPHLIQRQARPDIEMLDITPIQEHVRKLEVHLPSIESIEEVKLYAETGRITVEDRIFDAPELTDVDSVKAQFDWLTKIITITYLIILKVD